MPYIIFDSKTYIRQSNSFYINDSEIKLKADIIMRYHSLEKGISMPQRKIPFGFNVLKTLVNECNEYGARFGFEDMQVIQAVKILNEYYIVHTINGYEFDLEMKGRLLKLFDDFSVKESTKQHELNSFHYSETASLDFLKFSGTRISNRNYSNEDVPYDIIDSAVRLSLNYPSACNRQPGRVYVVSGEEIKNVLAFQTGNRGFGQHTNKLVIVTCDISGYSDPRERNLMWVDGGLFSMNILYSLHYYGLAACPLNWAVKPKTERDVHKICNIPNSERIVLMISCGYPKEKFVQPISLRYELGKVLKYV
ncbi:hypothetical protein GCM10011418_43040 [Sphingobacterium alkalisoli]|nr:hypothetical protein GCM10011418_43040 [Sphingobacterium alkalisoli]